MAIEVTFNAQAAENRRFSGECNACSSKAQWLASDSKRIRPAAPPRLAFETAQIDCPVCGAEMSGDVVNDFDPASLQIVP